MKHIFHKSFVLIVFLSAISFILTFGLSLFSGNQLAQEINFNDKSIFILMTALVTALLLLNMTDVLSFWLKGKSQIFFVKNLVGINRRNIYFPLYLNLNLLILLSFAIGVIFAFTCAFFFSNIILIRITLKPLLISFLFCMILVNVFSIVIIKYRLRRGFMELKK